MQCSIRLDYWYVSEETIGAAERLGATNRKAALQPAIIIVPKD